MGWAGLAPAAYESAGKTAWHITKRGSKYLQTVLIKAAQVIARGKPNWLKQFFLQIGAQKGYKKGGCRVGAKGISTDPSSTHEPRTIR